MRRSTRRAALGLAAAVLAAAALVTGFLLARGEDSALAVVPDSLVKIDPKTGEIVDVFRVGVGPYYARPAIVGEYVFLSSTQRETLSRIDVRSGDVDTFGGVTTSPGSVAAGADGTVWVGSERVNRVWQLDADAFELIRVIELPTARGPWSLAVGAGSVWASEGYNRSVSRFSVRTGKLQERYFHDGAGYSAEIAFGNGAAWAAGNGGPRGRLLRVGALTEWSESIEIGQIPYSVAVGFNAVWVSDLIHAPWPGTGLVPGKVLRVDPATKNIDDVIDVGTRPAAIAIGGGSVWVANGGERSISQIDPRTNQVVRTIATRYFPHSLAYGHGFLWVSLGSRPFVWDD